MTDPHPRTPDDAGRPAVVLLSGGLDSATVVAIARSRGFRVHALSFRYGQRHGVELEAARRVALRFGVEQHRVAEIDLAAFGGSALTASHIPVPKGRDLESGSDEIPVTYVPARNTIFLSFALAWAEVLGSTDIFLGINALDYSGYPDCRPEYLEAFQRMANLATRAGVQGERPLTIHAPLLHLTKAQIVREGLARGVDYSETISCYDPSPEGVACGECDACQLRMRGFAENGAEDPRALRRKEGTVKRYGIREVFGTLQGEGAQAGTPAVFLRFAGCNLGYAVCPWCDTDWAKAHHVEDLEGTLALVRAEAEKAFGSERPGLLLVATGGEPSLQLDRPLSDALRRRGYRIAMESNGSRPVDRSLVDWLTVSPKQAEFAQKEGEELKVLFTGQHAPGITPDVESVLRLAEGTRFGHYFLQPVDIPEAGGPNYAEAVAAVMRLGPPWRLSVQSHKVLAIP